jgi:hypothetical protein
MLIALRIVGGWAVLAAVIALVNDVTHAYETGAKFAFASLGKDWYVISPSTQDTLRTGIEKHVAHMLWDPVIVTILKAPAFSVLGLLGVLLFAAGLRRRSIDVFAN